MTANGDIIINGTGGAANSRVSSSSEFTLQKSSSLDLQQIWAWNRTVPSSVNRCVHEIIQERAAIDPRAPAICAWDGDMTYGELDQLSSSLSYSLAEVGLGSGSIVPLCFEKSMWTTVAMLGVIKTGAAFVLLDPSLPECRLRAIVDRVKGRVMVSAHSQELLSLRLAPQVMTLGSDSRDALTLPGQPRTQTGPVEPSSAAYVAFTSGSTGVPKGVIITHRNLASALHHQEGSMKRTAASRVYDFASYSFDASICNVFATLAVGGCLCVPSEGDRQDHLAESIAALNANTIDMTPSVARLLSTELVPSIKTIILGGETSYTSDVTPWWGKVQLVNLYGPCECTPNSTFNENPASPEEATQIGRGVGSVTWIVDADDHDSLLPVGQVGELLLEGPLVGNGYLEEVELTAAAFIKDPPWLRNGIPGQPGRQGRLYKTGDLVRYNANGSLSFVGRKDQQVKVRGQRLELGEIEHVILTHAAIDNAAVVLQRVDGQEPRIIGFVTVHQDYRHSHDTQIENHVHNDIRDQLYRLLEARLPSYMVPQDIMVLDQLPLTQNGKINRRALADKVPTREDTQKSVRKPTSWAERKLQNIWARVLGVDPKAICPDDNLIHLGGHSITAMRIVAEARKLGLKTCVADVLRYPVLHELAERMAYQDAENAQGIEPFALVADEVDVDRLRRDLADQYHLDPMAIQDAYPCTALQEGLISLTEKRPGDYIRQGVLQLSARVTLDKLQEAWETAVRAIPVLRTRVVQHSEMGFLQVVLDEAVDWIHATGLDEYLDADRHRAMGLGQPLTRYALVKDTSGTPEWFVCTIHHALYDGWSMRLMMDVLERAYRGEPVDPGPQFQLFIKYIATSAKHGESTATYWQRYLSGYQSVAFPALPPCVEEPVTDQRIEYKLGHIQDGRADVTTSTMIRAAWALVIGRMVDSDDIVFGTTVYGRNAPVPGLQDMMAPAIATVPVRIRLARDMTVSEYLGSVQWQAVEMIPFEQTGLQKVASTCPEGIRACMFQTHVVIQPQDNMLSDGLLGDCQDSNEGQWFNTYAFTLEIWLGNKDMTVSASFDSRVLEPWLVHQLLRQFDHVMHQLYQAKPGQALKQIDTMACQDLEQVWEWNKTVPAQVQQCVHEAIEDAARAHPEAPAVCGWDGNLTYGRLNEFATRLAAELVLERVGSGTLVPLCFEKSVWTAVAALGVAKTGAGFVLLDPSLPEQRLHDIVQQIKGAVMLSSVLNQELSSRLCMKTITLSGDFFEKLPKLGQEYQNIQRPHPSSVLYAVFTSGSTGTPKGVLITHANVASALHHQRDALGITRMSRIYDFASYSFDVSLNNMFMALSSGGCLCVPSEEDRINNLEQSIKSFRANYIDITPSAAQSICAINVPEVQTIVFGGEGLPLKAIEQWWDKARVIQIYGPCECSPTSTINHDASSPQGVLSIGKGVGLVTWVVDPDDHNKLLPPGCVGELLLEGPLVGRGYLGNDDKTAASFVEDPAWLVCGTAKRLGRRGRLYKTGDLVRYNEGGSLTFVGRKDAQVKIRGQRVELGEIEHVVRSHDYVRDSAAILQHAGRREPRVVCFVALHETDGELQLKEVSNQEAQHVKLWASQFNDEYSPIDDIRPETIGRDFMGWTSMYDGSDIDKQEMNEWLDDTIDTMLNGGSSGHVLEIGTGSGMVLFNLASSLKSYVGIEPTERAMTFVLNRAKSIPGLADKVRMVHGTASDINELDTLSRPQLVVLNSVIQYFPTQAYLFKVIRDLLQLPDVRTIFFGDVRSYALHKEFLVARATRIATQDAREDEIHRIITDMESAESELLVDPAFFTDLPNRVPGRIEHVEILPKKMHATNELSSFRYAAVIHAKSSETGPPVHDIGQDEWINFVERGLDRESLLDLLKQAPASSVLAVSNIPNSKTAFERSVVDLLNDKTHVGQSGKPLRPVSTAGQTHASLSTMDLFELAQQAGFHAEVSWARQHSQRGGFDAVFHRYAPVNGHGRTMFRFPTDHRGRPLQSLTSQPIQQQMRQTVQSQLQQTLKSRLPSYMVPQIISIVDKMPLSQNGKIDRRALENLLIAQPTPRPVRRPGTSAETRIQKIWGKVLDIDPAAIGLDDNFFQLGGNSISAVRFVAEARRAGMALATGDVFRHPVLHELACLGVSDIGASSCIA